MAGLAMIEYLEAFASQISEWVEDAECEVARVGVTAGRPSAPVGNCRAVYVFFDDLTDRNQNADTCITQGRLRVNYEIWSCYNDDTNDLSVDQMLADADCFLELVSLVWCGIIAAKDAGTLMDLGSCDLVEVGPLEGQPRQGMATSALGFVVIPYDC